jgi:hypothetical protein
VTQTVHYQQTSLLEAQCYVDPDPRKIFIDNLIELIQIQEQDPLNMCIVMMDANNAIEDKERSLRKIFKATNLVDVFTMHTGQECEIPTGTRGAKRIDFILASY